MIEWARSPHGETWSARLDDRLLATVRRAGIDWGVRWHVGPTDETSAPLTFALRENAMAAVEMAVLRLIAAGELRDVSRSGEESP